MFWGVVNSAIVSLSKGCNWNDLGNGHFIGLATAINLAQVGWALFQTRIREGEFKLQAKRSSLLASWADQTYYPHIDAMSERLEHSLEDATLKVWHLNRALSAFATILGLAMLFFGFRSAWDVLLLLPPGIYLVWSWGAYSFFSTVLWIADHGFKMLFTKKLPAFPSKNATAKAVKDFVDETRQELDLVSSKWKCNKCGKRTSFKMLVPENQLHDCECGGSKFSPW